MQPPLLPLAFSVSICGWLMLILSVPLILGKVPRNRFYGVRIRASLASDERWYRINAYGGRVLAWWSVPVTLTGAAGWFVAPEYFVTYALATAAITLLAVGWSSLQIALWCRKQRV